MLLQIIVSVFCVSICILLYSRFKRSHPKIFFIGPHGTGKTSSILSLLGLTNKTVTTLSNHRVIYKNREIIELVPDDETMDFMSKFHLNTSDTYVFFVKNEEEIDEFPDVSPFKIKFVLWKKMEVKNRKDLIYLEESSKNLRDLIVGL